METRKNYQVSEKLKRLYRVIDDAAKEVENWPEWMQEGEVRFNERRYSKS